MEKVRGFEVAKGFEDKNINLPVRKTKFSAGYDVEAAEDVIVPSFKKGMAPTLIKTGIKAYMPDDEVLMLYNRSSNPKKKGLILANSVGVVDKDYYGNPDNDGHIMFAFYNVKDEDVEAELRRLQERNSRLVAVEGRAAENGDTATIDFSGSVDGKKFEGGTSENYPLVLGSGSFIPGFEEQVVGMNVGEEKDVKVKFPDDYQAEELKGKDAVFAVTINGIYQ